MEPKKNVGSTRKWKATDEGEFDFCASCVSAFVGGVAQENAIRLMQARRFFKGCLQAAMMPRFWSVLRDVGYSTRRGSPSVSACPIQVHQAAEICPKK